MIFKNLLRRKGRSLLTILGVSIGVAAMIGLGALANGIEAGYTSMLEGSQADLVLGQPNTYDISMSAIDESVEQDLLALPEVDAVSGMLEGFLQTASNPYFFVFGYPEESFLLERFQILEGASFDSPEAHSARGKPLLLGKSAAEIMKKGQGDSLQVGDTLFRIIGVYETGDAFEDGGCVIRLKDAQILLGKTRQVSLFFIRLDDPGQRERFISRIERRFPDLSISTTAEYNDKQLMGDSLRGFVWAIAGLAILIGGIGMMNSQLMSVFERTQEIGVLRALGWSSRRVLFLILGESLLVTLLGGALGTGLGWLALKSISSSGGVFGVSSAAISSGLVIQGLSVSFLLGLVGGGYPAWRAAHLEPVEALRYEGGSLGKVHRLPVGGMALQSLYRRTARTLLTLSAIGVTVGAIMALEGMVRSMTDSLTGMAFGADAQIVLRQANISDTSMSAVDERVGDKIAALPEVDSISSLIFTALMLPDTGSFFILQGYHPREYAIQRIHVVEGKRITGNHQVMLGRTVAEAMQKQVGDTIELSNSRFKVVGIFESGNAWEALGGVVSLRDAQALAGRPRKVTMYGVRLVDPKMASQVAERINMEFPEVHAALAGEFVDQLPDMEVMDEMMGGISGMAIFVGGIGVMNAMLMAVLERTREIGVMRALGWRRRAMLGLILRESLLIGLLGGLVGILLAFTLAALMVRAPVFGEMLSVKWEWDIFARAITVALILGLLGGLYPAYRATRMQPVEALRYE